MRPDKEFKDGFNHDWAEVKYSGGKMITTIVVWILGLSLVFGAFGFGYKYIKTNADREIFKQSVTYNEGKLDDLANYKYQYDMAVDDIEREAIASLVRNRFANFDKSKIENANLVQFLKECGV